MGSSIIQKIIVALIVTLLLVVFGYITYTSLPDTSTDILTSENMEATTAGQDILVLVEQLQKISINQKIFSSPLFNNLKDYSVPITTEQHGRINPFVPIESDISVANPVVLGGGASTPAR